MIVQHLKINRYKLSHQKSKEEKSFDLPEDIGNDFIKILYPFMIKTHSKLETEGNLLNMIDSIYRKRCLSLMVENSMIVC